MDNGATFISSQTKRILDSLQVLSGRMAEQRATKGARDQAWCTQSPQDPRVEAK